MVGSSVLALALMSAALAADGPVLYANDFESGQGEWTMTDSAAWELATEDGNTALALVRASKYLPPVRAPQNIAWIADLDLGRFVLEADLKQTGREYGHRDLCLFIGGQDARHYYYVHLASVADEHANSIFIVNGAPRESIAVTRTSGSSWGDTWHHVKLVPDIDAGAIEVYFDDMATPAMTANDTTFASGTVGIGSFDDVGLFDNIVIRPLRE